ncbi:DUF2752 domain-containing protein [Tenacibaculum finnmarkense genomovar ulcerans]|nr:DUF2752 domain-containing protein [Tenacibaculum finnmarkense genomovar ulcerans]
MAFNKSTQNDYLIINTAISLIFIIGFLYLILSENTINCYYKDIYKIDCPSCGLTRDFKTILNFKWDFINPISPYYFFSLSTFFISRIFLSILTFKFNLKKIILFDLFFSSLLFICLIILIFL